MTTLTAPTPQQEVAAEWMALDGADIKMNCASCSYKFPVQGTGGPSLICPICGFFPGKQSCRYIMDEFSKRRKRGEIAAAAEEPAEIVTSAAPPGLDDVIGNASAVAQIRTALDAHRARLAQVDGRTLAAKSLAFPHAIFCSSGGTGKSMLAKIIAAELGRPFRLITGQSLQNPRRVVDMLRSIRAGDVIFIDEIQSLKDPCQTMLLLAMEDGIVVPIEKAGSVAPAPIRLPAFTLIAATTDKFRVSDPLLQRFKYIVDLERMSVDDLASAIGGRAERNKWAVTNEAATLIAARAHGTPRVALRLLDACRDVALAGNTDVVDAIIVKAACAIHRIDELGLNSAERRYLELLGAAAGPVRPNVIASQMDNQTRLNLERKVEPELIYLGLIEKTQTGRILTTRGREHLRSKA